MEADLLDFPELSRQSGPEFAWSRELLDLTFLASREVELHDALAIGRVGELETENLSVVACLLKAATWELMFGLGFHDGDHEIRRVAEKVVGLFSLQPCGLRS